MIKHIVMWKFADSAAGASKEENIAKVTRMLYALPPQIPLIRDMQIKRNCNHNGTNYDAILLTEFATLADVGAYRDHPLHQEVSRFVAQVTMSRSCVDYEI